MKIKTMRFVDHWVGKPVCFVLTVFHKLAGLFKRSDSKAEIKSILFVKLAEQGATVLADSAIRKAVGMVGRENVYFLVFQQNRFILDVMNLIPEENVITINEKNLATVFFDIFKAVFRMRKLHIDAAINFEFFARSSAILTYLSGAKIRAGLHSFSDESPYQGDLMTHRIVYNPHLHTSQMFETMVEAIKQKPEDLPRLDIEVPKLTPVQSRFIADSREMEEFRKIVTKETQATEFSPLVLINANASDMLPLRKWPSERYEELAKRLVARFPSLHIAFTGSSEESPRACEIVRNINSPRCFSMTGKTTLRQLMMLYNMADILITNDSGPAHFAALTDIQVITLFGPETPKLFGAIGAHSHILWKGLPCSPCVSAYNNRNSVCKDNVCMQRISVDEVFDLVCQLCKE
ncbi:MAG: glycosyltransferase family 9 protein [Phycisphaerales bacterium]